MGMSLDKFKGTPFPSYNFLVNSVKFTVDVTKSIVLKDINSSKISIHIIKMVSIQLLL